MRYYTAQIEIATDGTESRDLRGFDTRDEALSRFYQMLAKYVGNDKSILMIMFNETGAIEKTELWEASDDSTES